MGESFAAALKVGYAKVKVTPEESVPLMGYGNSSRRMSNNVLNDLYLTCLAFTDEAGETALIYALDACSSGNVCTERWRPAVSRATGIPVERIMVSASHSHSGPEWSNLNEPSIVRLKDRMEQWFLQAAREALDDRAPARGYVTAIETQGLNFVRRYVLENMTFAGDNYGRFKSAPIKCHESKADPMMRLMKLVREGKQDIVVANFQVHPHRTGGQQKLDISSDIVGVMRDKVERELGCCFAYFTGGAGNINPTSRIPEENRYADHVAQGEAMADFALRAEGSYREVKLGRVQNLSRTKTLPTNHSQDHMVEDAKWLLAQWKTPEDRDRCNVLGWEKGFNSVYHAMAVIEKAQLPEQQDIELNVISIGDVAFAIANYEMFDTNANEIRTGSPFQLTFVCTSANVDEDHGYMYIPSQMGYDHGGYSSDACAFGPGTGEKLAREYVYMLYELYHPET